MRPHLVEHTEADDSLVFVEQIHDPRWRGRCRYCQFGTAETWDEDHAGRLLVEHFATPEHGASVIAYIVDKHSREALYPDWPT